MFQGCFSTRMLSGFVPRLHWMWVVLVVSSPEVASCTGVDWFSCGVGSAVGAFVSQSGRRVGAILGSCKAVIISMGNTNLVKGDSGGWFQFCF